MTVYAFTGHRPKSLRGSELVPIKDLDAKLVRFCEGVLRTTPGITEIISGMAEGFDLAVAEAAHNLGLPYVAAIPFEGQERYWGAYSQMRYRRLRLQAVREHIIFPFSDKSAYKKRDEWMVDSCEALIGLWSGDPKTGTGMTMNYAKRWCVPYTNVWDRWKLN